MTAPALETTAAAAPRESDESARARGWKLATWCIVGLIVAALCFVVFRSSDGAAPPALPEIKP